MSARRFSLEALTPSDFNLLSAPAKNYFYQSIINLQF